MNQGRSELLKEKARRLFFQQTVQDNPAAAISEFLAHFGFQGGKAKLHRALPAWVVEYLADCFRPYWKSGGSLNKAFSLKAKKRGARTPREKILKAEEKFCAKFVYGHYLAEESAKPKTRRTAPRGERTARERALRRTATDLHCSIDKVKKLLLNTAFTEP